MFINRDWKRTEEDDFKLNVQTKLNKEYFAQPIKINNQIVGWKIINAYE